MAEQHLNDADVDILFKQMRGKTMTQGMGADALPDPGDFSRLLNGAVQLA